MKKVTERTAGVRFTDFVEHPIDVSVRIYKSGERWLMAIKALGQNRDRMFIDMNQEHLLNLNVMLRQAAAKVLHHAGLGDTFDDKEQLEIDLRDLAKAGNFVFNEIFKDKARKTIQNLFSDAKKLNKNITIEIESENFFIPWELLYSDNVKKPSYERFWGMKYIISRVIIQDDRPGDIEPTTIYVDSKPKLGLFALENNSLPSIANKEIPFFKALKKSGRISLRQLPGLDPNNKDSELCRFKDFLNRPLDVAHFACHAQYVENPSWDSFIQLSKGIQISLLDLAAEPTIAIRDFPLVVLNACKMGNMNPMDVHYFAGDFIRYGALGVIATEAEVPDDLAADFTEHLYDHLLDEKFLGESVLLARQELLKQGNPVGLLYALYAPPIIRLALRKGKNRSPVKRITA
jgi:hypothetical protein